MIIFQNPGLIDMAAVKTMGVSVKESAGAIGYFGTGLKFALATILREGGHVAIWRGAEEYKISAVPQIIRGESFDIVCINGEPMGFTTMLGRNWKPWMAFRELACNAKDEGGRYYSDMGDPHPADDETMIIVSGGGIDDAYLSRHEVLIDGAPLYANGYFEVRPGEGNIVYYRGVKIATLPKNMAFRYNILGPIELTEDRTARWNFQLTDRIASGLLACDDEAIIKRAMTCGDDFLEHHIDIPSWAAPTPAFNRVAADLRGDISDVLKANPAAMKLAETHRLANLGPESGIDLNAVEQQQFDKVSAMLDAAGYRIDEFEITIVAELGKGVMGMAKEKRIFIAHAAFEKGTREVAATLLEEYAHLKSGHGDATLGFQNWLFDQVLCQVEQRAGQAF